MARNTDPTADAKRRRFLNVTTPALAIVERHAADPIRVTPGELREAGAAIADELDEHLGELLIDYADDGAAPASPPGVIAYMLGSFGRDWSPTHRVEYHGRPLLVMVDDRTNNGEDPAPAYLFVDWCTDTDASLVLDPSGHFWLADELGVADATPLPAVTL